MSQVSGDVEDRAPEFQRTPDGYIRRSTLLQTVGACVGVLGAMLGLYRLIDGINESFLQHLQNERNERINADNRLDNKIDQWCRRR